MHKSSLMQAGLSCLQRSHAVWSATARLLVLQPSWGASHYKLSCTASSRLHLQAVKTADGSHVVLAVRHRACSSGWLMGQRVQLFTGSITAWQQSSLFVPLPLTLFRALCLFCARFCISWSVQVNKRAQGSHDCRSSGVFGSCWLGRSTAVLSQPLNRM